MGRNVCEITRDVSCAEFLGLLAERPSTLCLEKLIFHRIFFFLASKVKNGEIINGKRRTKFNSLKFTKIIIPVSLLNATCFKRNLLTPSLHPPLLESFDAPFSRWHQDGLFSSRHV